MVATESIAREKLGQAVEILGEQDVDLWLTFVRESLLTRDPSLDLVAGTYCAWQAAFLVSRSGEHTAIVGRFDAPNVVALGAYEVIPYDQNIREPLREAIERLDPKSIAINYSESDPAADGLTHGMWLVLSETLAGTPYADRFTSSEASSTRSAAVSRRSRSSASTRPSARPRRSTTSRPACSRRA